MEYKIRKIKIRIHIKKVLNRKKIRTNEYTHAIFQRFRNGHFIRLFVHHVQLLSHRCDIDVHIKRYFNAQLSLVRQFDTFLLWNVRYKTRIKYVTRRLYLGVGYTQSNRNLLYLYTIFSSRRWIFKRLSTFRCVNLTSKQTKLSWKNEKRTRIELLSEYKELKGCLS